MEGIIILFIIVAIAVFVFGMAQSKRADEAWAEAARQLKLSYEARVMFKARCMTGRIGGMGVRVDTYTRRSGKSSTTYTRFRVTYNRPLGLGLRLTREGFFSGVGKMFGAQDIEVGDVGFDADVIVKGTDPRHVIRFLTPARRLRIHRFLMARSNAEVGDAEIKWTRVGVMRDAKAIVAAARGMIRVASSLVGEREADRSVERAMQAQHEGNVEQALALLGGATSARLAQKLRVPSTPSPAGSPPAAGPPPVPPPLPPEAPVLTAVPPPLPPAEPPSPDAPPPAEPPSPDVPPPAEPDPTDEERGDEEQHAPGTEEMVLEGELLYMAGHRAEAKEVFDEALAETPDDPEVREWAERASRESPPECASGAPDVPLDVDAVCGALFDPAHTSLDANRIFEERYEGQSVSWTGVLRSVDAYSYDYVLGSTPGTKAVFEVYEVVSTLYGENKILAVVQLPEGEGERLEKHVGETFAIAGRLLRVDGFMRNVYLAEGTAISS